MSFFKWIEADNMESRRQWPKLCSNMSSHTWLGLVIIYVLYLALGGYTFQLLEKPGNCKIELSRSSDLKACSDWSFYSAVFFSFTAVTTIGYGHMAPATVYGKVFCIVYTLVGIPINGILVGTLGSAFNTWVNCFTKKDISVEKNSTRYLVILLNVFLLLVPGTLVFLVIPSLVIWTVEEWHYLDSFYYTFITLTTIGFGDYVAGRDSRRIARVSQWKICYQLCLMVWILFGLGYLFMLITIISDGLRTPGRAATKRFRAAQFRMLHKVLEEVAKNRLKKRAVAPASSNSGAALSSALSPAISSYGPEYNGPDDSLASHLNMDESELDGNELERLNDCAHQRARNLACLTTKGISEGMLLSTSLSPMFSQNRSECFKNINQHLLRTTSLAEFIEAVKRTEEDPRRTRGVLTDFY